MSLGFRSRMRSRAVRVALIGTSTAAVAAFAAVPAQASPAADPENAAGAFPGAAVRMLTQDLDISRAEATDRLESQSEQVKLARQLENRLESSGAGTWIDPATGELVMNVTSSAAADRVRAAGAEPNKVVHSSQELTSAKAELDRLGDQLSGDNRLTWGIDVVANSVAVQVPKAATDADTRQFLDRARSLDPAITVQRVAGSPRTHAFYGGDAIHGGGSRCSAGFIAESGGTQYVITAGHCTNAISSWTDGSQTVGSTVESDFPGNDYGLIEISDPGALDPRGAVLNDGSPQDITGAGEVPVGATVCKTGSTTGTTCGQVLAYDTTVNYPSGTVSGLTETDVCTQAGDSGGALFAGSEAQGITSGGTTVGCDSSSFRAYFQPVGEALSAYGLTLK